ncbi:MAG: TIGR01777 family oxidoreductase [Anaerolineales bacterium]|nr:TIGR01777 family oxidoreductase [Anaerolineales bacterium]MCX7609156.1 TIGR01777 family oxidoreductase [Anaerolineales bacterium]
MRILMTGATGLIGRSLIKSFLEEGHSIWALTRRNPPPPSPLPGLTYLSWDGQTTNGWGEKISETDVVINLAGEPLARWPWTAKRKKRFWDSRVHAGQALTAAIQSARSRPQVLIQASGINHYGLRGELADETTPPGDDFLARLTIAWEESTRPVEELGVRRCILRLAVVLAKEGGLFPLMALPVRLFLGGPLGNGRQPVPWIHLDDVVGAIRFLIAEEQTQGAYNLIAPEVVSNAEFYRVLSKSLRRPYWFPTPAFLLRLVLGEMSTLILEGRPAQPRRLLEAGYRFQAENLNQALQRLLAF